MGADLEMTSWGLEGQVMQRSSPLQGKAPIAEGGWSILFTLALRSKAIVYS